MSAAPFQCRYFGCTDLQVHAHMCERHYRLIHDAHTTLDAEPMERDS